MIHKIQIYGKKHCVGSNESGQDQIRSEAKRSIFEYIEMYYNRIRRHPTLNYKPPVDFERLAGVA